MPGGAAAQAKGLRGDQTRILSASSSSPSPPPPRFGEEGYVGPLPDPPPVQLVLRDPVPGMSDPTSLGSKGYSLDPNRRRFTRGFQEAGYLRDLGVPDQAIPPIQLAKVLAYELLYKPWSAVDYYTGNVGNRAISSALATAQANELRLRGDSYDKWRSYIRPSFEPRAWEYDPKETSPPLQDIPKRVRSYMGGTMAEMKNR